jgi:hypothetical protein
VLSALLGAPALLLLAAGAAKVADPTRTVGALRALGWPASPALVRAGAAGEAVLGASALVVGGPVAAGLVVASFLGFAAFVAGALRAGTAVGSCGCFGREDTPPRPRHVAVDVALAAAAAVALAGGSPALLDGPPAAVALAAAGAAGAYALLTDRP